MRRLSTAMPTACRWPLILAAISWVGLILAPAQHGAFLLLAMAVLVLNLGLAPVLVVLTLLYRHWGWTSSARSQLTWIISGFVVQLGMGAVWGFLLLLGAMGD